MEGFTAAFHGSCSESKCKNGEVLCTELLERIMFRNVPCEERKQEIALATCYIQACIFVLLERS